MQDIFGNPVQDYDVVSFPFVRRGPYRNSIPDIWLSYGVVKGKRVYTLDAKGNVSYKVIHNPESMLLRLNAADLPHNVMVKLENIRAGMNK